MAVANLDVATERLSPSAMAALEEALALCAQRTNYKLEPEHWLLAMLRLDGSDVQTICRRARVDLDALDDELNVAIDNFKRGDGSRRPEFSPQTVEMLENAWLAASMRFNAPLIRGGHLLFALMDRTQLWRVMCEQSPQLRKLKLGGVESEVIALAQADGGADAGPEEPPAASPSGAAAAGEAASGGAGGAASGGKKSALDRFAPDLTAQAAAGKLDPVVGRDHEIDQCLMALSRRRKSNPILVGDAGVGKTAIVEGLAHLMAAGKVDSPILKNAVLRSLDLGALQAGAGVRGEFEERLRGVLDEIAKSPVPVVLFIDEIHTLVGSGGAEGQGDAANLLKPALARGGLKCIGATTWAEYKKYFENDAALARRFEVVKVAEPDEPTACYMLRGMLGSLEQHHGVRVLDEAVTAAVKLSKRYIAGRQLPDKAVSLLDTACTTVALSTSVSPPAVQDARREIDDLDHALRVLRREQAAGGGADVDEQVAKLEARRASTATRLEALERRYAAERDLVAALRTAWDAASAGAADGDGAPARTKVTALREQLAAARGDAPLAHAMVDAQAVADVVSRWTGIPVGRMNTDELTTIRTLEQKLGERVIGQTHALTSIAETIRKNRAGLSDPNRPVGVFLLLGTSGVGKTETAVALADLLFGGPSQLTTINMSEFKEEAKISQLLGASAGYVGFGEGGVLTEAVRRKPHSVLLLDECEKAHRAVHDIFLGAFDKGVLRDGQGRDIDFKNTLVILTSNAASAHVAELCATEGERPSPDEILAAVQDTLLAHFRAEFLGRMTPIVYYPLSRAELAEVARLQLERLAKRVEQNYGGAALTWDRSLIDHVVGQCNDRSAGARVIDRVLNKSLMPPLAGQLLARAAEGTKVKAVTLSVADGEIRCAIA